MYWLHSGNLLFRVVVLLILSMSEVSYVCYVSFFDLVAFVFVMMMMILSFLFFLLQGREAMYSTLHDSRYMVSRVMSEDSQDQIVTLDGMVLHLFEYLLVEC